MCHAGSARSVDMEERTSSAGKLAAVFGLSFGDFSSGRLGLGSGSATHAKSRLGLDVGARFITLILLLGFGGLGVGHLEVNECANDSDLALLALPDGVHLHGHAHTVVQVFAGKVEVELFEGVGDVLEAHCSLASNNFASGSEVLKFSFLDIRDIQVEFCSGDDAEVSGDHVDWGLMRAGVAHGVGLGI